MGRIVQLSKNVINQIAAGEVIERPYSVVKELVENSIDAGSTKISIEISNECRNIRVADNGSGIYPDDIILAFTKHATSKIQSGEDLYSVKTMGFRGEALASIISISKVTCITKTKDFEYGTKVECENSEVKQSKTGCAVGTIMEIRDLFYNLPARLKFLKSSKTEFSYISELIQSLALVHPEISFELKNNGKATLKTTGQNDQIIVVKEVFSDEISKKLVPLSFEDRISNIELSGYVSTPDFTRASKKDYYTYVNSRIVKCPVFQKAIDTVYKNLTGTAGYPFVIININISPEDIDVNVHPAKKEIRYKNPNQVFNLVYTSINKALSENQKKTVEYTRSENYSHETFSNGKTEPKENSFCTESEDITVNLNENISGIFSDVKTPSLTLKENSPNIQESKPIFHQKVLSVMPEKTEQEELIIGQYKKTYILIEREEGLEIVDQHIADERYIYEQLKKSKNVDCQLLFISDIIEVSHSDKDKLERNKYKLEKFGYEIESVSETEVIFRKVPQLLSKISPKEILADILENISGDIDNIEEQILITTSCKAAVKANTFLNQFQMQEIIKNWRTCENPQTCPHGRPISKIIEHKDIAKFFLRNK